MRLLRRMFHRSDEHRLQVQGGPPQQYLPAVPGIFTAGGRSDAGVHVDELTALTASAVFACVNVISNAVASLPIHVKHKDEGTEQRDHPVYRLLHDSPNEFMTAATFREALMVNLLLWGNAYAYIERDELGNATALYPLRSAVTLPVRFNGGLLQYRTIVGTSIRYLNPDQVFHVMGLTLDGITGLSPIAQARQSVGLSLALEKFAARFFSNGGNMGGILSTPPMKEEALTNFVASWKKNYTGPDNAFKVAFLPDGYKFTQTTTEPEKAQALEARINQVREIARIFRVPPHKIGDLERATFSNIEQQSIEFMQDTVQPWAVKWEQEANRKLFLEREKPSLEVRFNLDALLRADTAARYAAYNVGKQGGWLTTNEIRRREGLPPVEGGDTLLQPLNMGPTNPTPGNGAAAEPQPTAARALIEDAARRILTKEAKAIARAAKKFSGKPSDLKGWADTFYAAHAGLVARTFAAPLAAAKLSVTSEEFAREHCAASIRAIVAVADAGTDAQDLADEFTDIRPSEIAQHLFVK
jgi:HK97 family phage portal protein